MHLNVNVRFHLNGDLKGVMQLLGQSGYDSHHCVHCKIGTRSKMGKFHEGNCTKVEEPNAHDL